MKKFWLFILVTLTMYGCTGNSNTKDYFTFGLSKSCFGMEKSSNCNLYKANDKLVISVNQSKQEVTYQLKGLRLDETNTIFNTLDDCKVIDAKNFSCAGLVVVDGQFKDTKVIDGKVVSSVSWLSFYSEKLELDVKRETIKFIEDNNAWLVPAFIVGIVLSFLLIS